MKTNLKWMLALGVGALLLPLAAWGEEADKTAQAPLSARDAMVKLPADVLDLLTSQMRRDMLAWYDADSIAPVLNTMEGESWLIPPLTDSYLKMQVTPVTTLTIRTLDDTHGHGPAVMTIYTIGDSLQAKDSDVKFYDASFQELPRHKYLKLVSTADFLETRHLPKREREELAASIPYPTVEYTMEPGSDTLRATLTVGDFMGREELDRIRPHLRPHRSYVWDGRKFKSADSK